MIRIILVVSGTIALIIGIIGIFIPGLPTTPFLLLAAGAYIRSSEKLYQILIRNRFVGPYIKDFNTKKGMTVKTKIYSIATMWVMIFCSVSLISSSILFKLCITGIGVIGTAVMGFIIPTVK